MSLKREGKVRLKVSMKKISLMTSGGDAPGMNAAIRSVVRNAIYRKMEVIGFRKGFDGIIDADFCQLYTQSVGGIIDRGGTFLETARSERFLTARGQEKAVQVLKENNIDGLVIIGGDGSFRGASRLEELGMRTVGIPGTIDNDISGTDYSIGFDTCLNTIIEALSKIRDTASSLERIFCVEVMGRLSGEIALHAGLAGGADFILIPEIEYNFEDMCNTIVKGFERGKNHIIILVAEGAAKAYDVAAGISFVTKKDVKVTVLGHIQRGGSPSAMDRILASRFGGAAVEALASGVHGRFVGIQKTEIVLNDYSMASKSKHQINKKMYELAKILSI